MVILPPPPDNSVIDTSCYTRGASPAYYFNFGSRFGDDGPEAYTDLILPFFDNGQNLVFLNPRASIAEEGQSDLSLGLGLRRMVAPGLVVGAGLFTDSAETRSGNTLNQWGAGLEVLSDWVDFRANWYDASSSKKKNGEYSSAETETSSVTTAKTTSRTSAKTTTTTTAGPATVTRTKTGERTVPGSEKTTQTTVALEPKVEQSGGTGTGKPSEPYAIDHEIRYDVPGGATVTTTPRSRTDSVTTARVAETWDVTTTRPVTTRRDTTYTTTAKTTYRTETTHTTTTKLFERFERGMDGWDAELGFRLPWRGPETRLFGGYYDYDNPFGEDVEGWKARLEVKPGPWLSLDGELYENGRLHGSDWFVGFRAQIPLSRDLSWKDFKEGLFSLRPRCLEERMRGEMARREGVHAAQSPWGENLAKRRVEKRVEVDERTVTRTSRRAESSAETKTETTRTTETGPEREVVLDSKQGQVVEGTPQVVTTGSGPGQTIKLADHITFVDGAHTGTTDGKAATPYNNLQAAADAARNSGNTTVFVYEPGGRRIDGDKVYIAAGNGGKYEHGVEVHPGITLTSTVSGGVVTYQTVGKPLIDPPESALVKGNYIYPAAVLLHENTTLERMAVKTTGGLNEGILMETTGSTGGDVLIKDSDIDASGYGIISYVFAGQKLGDLSISGSTITAALGDGVETRNYGTMGDLSISGSTITAQGRGVYTRNYSTMGNVIISGSTITSQEDGVLTHNAGTMGDMSISGSTITAQDEGVWTINVGTMGDLSISGSTITAQEDGVYTDNNGTMGGMAITGAAGKITGGAGYNDIVRRCFTGYTCQGSLMVDGAAMPETTETNGFGTWWQQAVWNNP